MMLLATDWKAVKAQRQTRGAWIDFGKRVARARSAEFAALSRGRDAASRLHQAASSQLGRLYQKGAIGFTFAASGRGVAVHGARLP